MPICWTGSHNCGFVLPVATVSTAQTPASGEEQVMTDRNEIAQRITRYLDFCYAGDTETLLAMLADDVVFDSFLGDRVIGHDNYRMARADIVHMFSPECTDRVIMSAQDATRGSAEITLRGTYRVATSGLPPATGQRFSVSAGLFFEFDGPLISRITEYANLADLARQLSRS